MINWAWIVARAIGVLGACLDAADLRNRVYRLEQQKEIMMTALTDIQRMDHGPAGQYARRVLKRIEQS